MVVLKWLNSILVGNKPEITQVVDENINQEKRAEKKRNGIDVANAAFVDHAEDLEELITVGSQNMKRRKLKNKIRQKISKVISDEYSDPNLIEEITERITDAVEIDPFYKKMFDNEEV